MVKRLGPTGMVARLTRPPSPRRPPSRRRRLVRLAVAAGAIAATTFVLLNLAIAVKAGSQGKTHMLQAERDLTAGNLARADRELKDAARSFARVSARVRGLGPVAAVIRRTPLAGSQLRAVETMASVGEDLARTGAGMVDIAQRALEPENAIDNSSVSLPALRELKDAVQAGVVAIALARDRIAKLDGLRLVPPVRSRQKELSRRVADAEDKAASVDQGLGAFITFVGGAGPRRYLYLSQNPDEVRPTGGVIGTYGVLNARDGKVTLEQFAGIEEWYGPRPQANVDPAVAGSPFRFFDPPFPRTIANVNTTPDWPTAARLALELWTKGGEAPVNGVISFTPSVLGRILSVIGPVEVRSYFDTITAENLVARLDFHAHPTDPALLADRKDFIGVLAEAVLARVLVAPSNQLLPLGRALGQAFEAREAMAYSTDADVAAALRDRGWDGALPSDPGDFFQNGEIEYFAKNGRGIRRTFAHHVAIRPDGSARITTEITLYPRNSSLDQAFHSYIILYGPLGATLAEGSDPPKSVEPPVAGHPAAGWFRGAGLSVPKATLTVAWDAPDVARQLPDGTWQYSLRWMRLPDHTGDSLSLSFDLPPGWRWTGPPPPAQFDLGQGKDLVGTWRLTAAAAK